MAIDSVDWTCFAPSRNLLHPKFESYKLSQQNSRVRKIQLVKPINLNIPQSYNSINLQELRSQSTWNHLLTGNSQVLWIEPATLEIYSLNVSSFLPIDDQEGTSASDLSGWLVGCSDPKLDPDLKKEDQVSSLLQLPDRRQELLSYQLDHPVEFEYPSGLALDPSHLGLNHPSGHPQPQPSPWLFVDGGRRLFLVDLNPKSPRLLAELPLDQPKFIHGFYKVQAVQPQEQKDTFSVILRAKSTQPTPPDDPSSQLSETNTTASSASKKEKKKNQLLYTIYLIQIRIIPKPCCGADPPLAYSLDICSDIQLNGSHDLLSAHYDKSLHRWCLRSASSFTTSTSTKPLQETDPSIQSKIIEEKYTTNHLASITPYNWSQTLSSVTLNFPVPSLVTSKSIKVKFESDYIHFTLIQLDHPAQNPATLDDYLENLLNHFKPPGTCSEEVDSSFENSQFNFKLKVWDSLKTEDCTWFIDSSLSLNQKTTIFTIELEKINRLRWPQVFKSDDQVHETMDPIELLSITQNLSKYTSHLGRAEEQEGQTNDSKRQKRGLGLLEDGSTTAETKIAKSSPAYLSNSAQEMMRDEEIIDTDNQLMVTGIIMTWLIEKQSEPNKNRPSDWIIKVAQNGIPVELISNPLKLLLCSQRQVGEHGQQGLREEEQDDLSDSIMIKSDVDGLVFKPPLSSNEEKAEAAKMELSWSHSMTFPGLSFILGSKTQICYSFFTDRFTILFESSPASSKYNLGHDNSTSNFHHPTYHECKLGNVYIYYRPEKNQITSSQKIIELTSEFDLSLNLKAGKNGARENEGQHERRRTEEIIATDDDRIIGVCGFSPDCPLLSDTHRLTTSIICLSKLNLFIFDL